jgi:tetratricopeptide (TPR) repeat protein
MALSSSQNQLNYLGPIALTDAEQRLPQAEGSIRLWERLNLVLADYAEAQMSSQYLRIHYEDLIQNPQRQIERLLRFLGLDADSASLAERIQPATGIARWQNQSPTWIAKIQSGGQKGLRRFGYLDQGSQQPEAVRKPPEDEAMSGLGAYERGEYGAAAEGLAPIIARAREVLPAFADSLHQQGRYSQAMDAWRQALAADGDNPGAWLGLGRSAQALNRNEEAITAFFEALKANPERPVDALSPLVELLNKEGRIADLEESMQQALDARQDDAELAALGARMQTLLGNLEAAAVLVRRVMRLRPDAPERVIPLFWRINAANGGEIAKQLSVDMLAAFPDDLDVLLVRAEISLGRERDPEYALNLCNQILAIAPQRHHTQILRGRCLMAVDRMDEAFEAYDQAIEHLGERASNALFHRARAHRKRGDLDAAVADLRRALAQNPQGHQIAMELEEVELTQTQQHRST